MPSLVCGEDAGSYRSQVEKLQVADMTTQQEKLSDVDRREGNYNTVDSNGPEFPVKLWLNHAIEVVDSAIHHVADGRSAVSDHSEVLQGGVTDESKTECCFN